MKDPFKNPVGEKEFKKYEEQVKRNSRELTRDTKFKYGIGLSHRDPKSGIKYLQKLLEEKVYPSLVECYYRLSIAYSNNNEIDEALKYCNMILKIAMKTEDINKTVPLMEGLLKLYNTIHSRQPVKKQCPGCLNEALDTTNNANTVNYLVFVVTGVAIAILLSIFYFLKG